MTPRDFAAMTDAELNEAAARRMGLQVWTNKPGPPSLSVHAFRPNLAIPQKIDPASDLNHAAELGAAFLAKYPSCYLVVETGRSRDSVSVYGASNQAISRVFGVSASEARARTVAVLTAWDALEGGE